MFISSTLYALHQSKNEVTLNQKLTGALELSGIIAVTVLALLIISNNSGSCVLPGLNSMSNLTATIILGSAVSLLIANLVALFIFQSRVIQRFHATLRTISASII